MERLETRDHAGCRGQPAGALGKKDDLCSLSELNCPIVVGCGTELCHNWHAVRCPGRVATRGNSLFCSEATLDLNLTIRWQTVQWDPVACELATADRLPTELANLDKHLERRIRYWQTTVRYTFTIKQSKPQRREFPPVVGRLKTRCMPDRVALVTRAHHQNPTSSSLHSLFHCSPR